jgi:membrane associated rhomboid family serine protease
MIGLWMFGSALEQHWGSKRFLIYYFVCGIGAALLHNTITGFQFAPMIADADIYMSAPSYTNFEAFVSNYLPGSFENDQINNFLVEWHKDRLNPGYLSESVMFVDEVVQFRMNIPTVGASGAIYGLLLAFGMTFPNAMIMMLIPPIPMKAKYFVVVFGAIELTMGLRNNLEDNVAHFAHLGGMLFGILIILWYKKQDRNRNVNHL